MLKHTFTKSFRKTLITHIISSYQSLGQWTSCTSNGSQTLCMLPLSNYYSDCCHCLLPIMKINRINATNRAFYYVKTTRSSSFDITYHAGPRPGLPHMHLWCYDVGHQLNELKLIWWPLAVLYCTCIRASCYFFYAFVLSEITLLLLLLLLDHTLVLSNKPYA